MKANIKRLIPDIELPKYYTAESAAFDIAVSQSYSFEPGQIHTVKTGLVIEAPEGHFLLIASRSSLPVKKGLTVVNGIGVIDRDYSGPNDEIMVILKNISNNAVTLEKGDRVAQGVFVKVDQVEWEETDIIRDQDRGGVGSTGGYNK